MLPTPTPTQPRRWLLLFSWIALGAMPVVYIATQAIAASRNIVFWDEFDTALALILRIHDGADWNELLQRFFAINNEHRTATSRLMFAVSYWLTGTVNFHVIGAIGNLFFVATCVILVVAVKGWERRVRIGVVLAFLMFQLEHFESFIWSGASIDHFQVVMLVVGAIAALARATRGGVALAVLLGFLATFTLAQGILVWPIGACLLWHQRRWHPLASWCVCGVAVVTMFLHGFEINPGHHIAGVTNRSLGVILLYWLALLGAPLTLGDAGFAPWPGAVLLIGFVMLVARGAMRREPVALSSAVFAIGALGLVAVGRSGIAGDEINSRYMVLGALAWALLIFILLEFSAVPQKPFRQLVWLTPALAAFNLCANLKFAPLIDIFVEVRDRAATSFMQYGEDGRGITRLHPLNGHADVLLKMAAERGVYRLPSVSHEASFPNAQPNPRIITHVDELVVNDRAVTIGGWAMIPGRVSRRDEIHVVLRSDKSNLVFSTVTLQRTDVAKAYNEPKWRGCGFRAVIERERLPAEDFTVGVLIAGRSRAEFLMTSNEIHLAPGKPANVQKTADVR
ncbi:MAG: hypothetical protein ACREF9_13615 [Opitutaceae bacterium]